MNQSLIAIGSILISQALFANQTIAEFVIRRAYDSIVNIEEGKAFLDPEKLRLEQGQIFLEGIAFPIPVVFSNDGLPPYTQVSESTLFNSWKCKCGTWNHKWDNPTHCWKCKEPR